MLTKPHVYKHYSWASYPTRSRSR